MLPGRNSSSIEADTPRDPGASSSGSTLHQSAALSPAGSAPIASGGSAPSPAPPHDNSGSVDHQVTTPRQPTSATRRQLQPPAPGSAPGPASGPAPGRFGPDTRCYVRRPSRLDTGADSGVDHAAVPVPPVQSLHHHAPPAGPGSSAASSSSAPRASATEDPACMSSPS